MDKLTKLVHSAATFGRWSVRDSEKFFTEGVDYFFRSLYEGELESFLAYEARTEQHWQAMMLPHFRCDGEGIGCLVFRITSTSGVVRIPCVVRDGSYFVVHRETRQMVVLDPVVTMRGLQTMAKQGGIDGLPVRDICQACETSFQTGDVVFYFGETRNPIIMCASCGRMAMRNNVNYAGVTVFFTQEHRGIPTRQLPFGVRRRVERGQRILRALQLTLAPSIKA